MQIYKPRSHFAPLDGLRGIAILSVIACHVRLGADSFALDRGVSSVFGFGVHGVDLFFVLSGFLITGILLDTKDSPGYFRVFYARRTLRIFPLYYLYLALRLLVAPALAHHFHLAETPMLTPQQHGGYFWLYTANLLTAIHSETVIQGGLFHMWSLAVEEQFYLFWPLLVFFVRPKNLARVCAALIVLSFALRFYLVNTGEEAMAASLTICRVDALAAGALIALAVRYKPFLARLPSAGILLIALASAGIIGRLATYGWEDTHAGWVTVYGVTLAIMLSAGLVLALISGNRWVQALCDQGWLRQIGKYSYSMYVFHFVVLRAVEGSLTRAHLPRIFGSRLLEQFLDLSLVTLCTFGVALLTWHCFEKWFLKLKDHFSYRRARQRAEVLDEGHRGAPV